MGVAIKPPKSMNTLTLGLLLSSVCVAVLSSPTHSGGKNGSGAKCKPRTVCSQVPSSKCSTVYEERCSQPTKEVCDQVTRVSQHNRCTTTYSRVCTGGDRDTRDRKQENVVHQCKKVSDGARKCEKVPVKKCSAV